MEFFFNPPCKDDSAIDAALKNWLKPKSRCIC